MYCAGNISDILDFKTDYLQDKNTVASVACVQEHYPFQLCCEKTAKRTKMKASTTGRFMEKCDPTVNASNVEIILKVTNLRVWLIAAAPPQHLLCIHHILNLMMCTSFHLLYSN